MPRALVPRFWSRLAALLLLPGCLVSFNDYPLGGGADTSAAGASSVGPDPSLIDDFEDGDERIVEVAGRSGSWYAGNDGKGMQTPPNGQLLVPSALNPARDGSTRAAHTFGGPFQVWGALIGTSFASSGEQPVPYDLSGHMGLRLWVRSGTTAPNAAKQVRLNLPMPATNMGGGCTVCNDHYGFDIPLTSKWEQIEVPFAMLKQQGYGMPKLKTPDLEHVISLQLAFPKNVSFDLWVDDITLY